MWHLQNLLFILLFYLSCVTTAAELIHVFGYDGRDALISCSYEEGYESYTKYLCRSDCRSEDVLIETTGERKDKYSITDDTRQRVFTTTIFKLGYGDAGKYWCGVSRSGKDIYTEVKLEVGADSCCDRSITVRSYEGTSASIRCPYESQYQSNMKYICRGNQPSTCLEKALVTSKKNQNGQFSLSEGSSSSFTVTVTGLTQSNHGSYLCGIQRATEFDVFSAVVLEVKENRCCESATKVQSYDGGSVFINCSYEPQYKSNMKYICRGNQPSTCLQQALVTSNHSLNRRFTLPEDTSKSFNVTINDVTKEDSGSYLCGVKNNNDFDVFSAVLLEVKENRCCDNSTKVQSYEGSSVSINCSYEPQYKSNMKYICRGNQPSTCLQEALVTSNSKLHGEFNLTDDRLSSFTVTITGLTQRNNGSYLCGVQRKTDIDIFSAVLLEVKEWCCVRSDKLSGTMGRPITIQCPYPPQPGATRKFLCKGDHQTNCTDIVMSESSSNQTELRFSLHDDVSSSSFSVTITELEEDDAGTYWCGTEYQRRAGRYNEIQLSVDSAFFHSVVFIVPPVVMLLLIIILVLVCKNKCHKAQGTAATVNRTNAKAADAEEVIDEADIYENHDIVMSSKRENKPYSHDNDAEDNNYENFCVEQDIYCNQFHSTGKLK